MKMQRPAAEMGRWLAEKPTWHSTFYMDVKNETLPIERVSEFSPN